MTTGDKRNFSLFAGCLIPSKFPFIEISSRKVLEGLGLEPRPPFPQGYTLEPGDLSALERVRARGQLWRDAG